MNHVSRAANDLPREGALAWALQSGPVIGRLLVLAVGYYLAVWLGLAFRFEHSQVGVIWPANAVLLSALLLSSRSRWWMVFAVIAAAHAAAMAGSVPVWRALWQIAGNFAFAAAAAALLRRFAGLPLRFETRRQVMVYAIICFFLPFLFAATTAGFVRSLLKLESATTPAHMLLAIALTNATALFVVAPLILLWTSVRLRRVLDMPVARLAEAGAVLITVMLVALIAFNAEPRNVHIPWLLLGVFPPLMWAAVRFGPLGAITSVFGIVALSILSAARHLGPFVLSSETETMLSMQIFWIVLCLPVMLLAAVIRERDNTEGALRELRNQLAHVSRVTTAAQLSSTLAHELKQPLTAIRANAETGNLLLARQPADLEQVKEILKDIVADDEYATHIITRYGSFIKTGDSGFKSIALETVVRDALTLLRSTAQLFQVKVEAEIVAGLPRLRGDSLQLTQVLLNLLVNGCESMTGVPTPGRHLRIYVARADERFLEIQVADRGAGLPGNGEDRIFQPFFTTKKNGLGLGLAICRSIVSAHGGRLFAMNNPSGGATFHLLLPADDE